MRREMLGLLKCVTCPHFSRTHLHLPSRRPTFQEVQNQPGQIGSSDLASILTPKSSLQKKQKNTLFRSDATDPNGTNLRWIWDDFYDLKFSSRGVVL
jgi:hypothetical protein